MIRERKVGQGYWPLRGSVYAPTEVNISPSLPTQPPDAQIKASPKPRPKSVSFTSPAELVSQNQANSKPPVENLELEFVHGYRGHDCRDNLFYTVDKRIVYHCAGVGVVYDPHLNSQKIYQGHNDDVVSLALHPDGKTVATGQVITTKGTKKPKICVWNITSLETLAVLEGFHDASVCALDFNQPTGNLLITIGTDFHNSICIYDWKKGEILSQSYGRTDKIFVVKSNPWDPLGFTTCGVKHIKFWKMEGTSMSSKYGLFKDSTAQTLLCMTFTKTKNEIVTGTFNGDLYLWQGNVLATSVAAHKGPAYAVVYCEKGLVSSGKDGKVIFWGTLNTPTFMPTKAVDLLTRPAMYQWEGTVTVRSISYQAGKFLLGTKSNEIYESNADFTQIRLLISGHIEELWALAAHPSLPQYVTGGNDNTIRMWDIPSRKLVKLITVEDRVKCLTFSPNGDLVAAGLENGMVHIMSSQTLQILGSFRERENIIDEIKYSPDGSMLAVGSHQNVIDLYNRNYELVTSLKGHSSSILHLDWSVDGKVIQSDSSDYEHLFWDVASGSQIVKTSNVRDIKWHSWTCILGWYVKGLFSRKDREGATINAVCRSFSENILVTGDSKNEVKLFRFPLPESQPKAKSFLGHSSFVTNVCFTWEDECVISVGGNDRSVFQWRVSVPKTSGSRVSLRGSRRSISLDADMLSDLQNTIQSNLAIAKEIGQLEDLKKRGLISAEASQKMWDILFDTKKERLLKLLGSVENNNNDLEVKNAVAEMINVIK